MIELADTSALILAHRVPAVGRVVQAAIGRNEIAVCAVVELEYLMGARNAVDYEALESGFAGFPRLPIDDVDWIRVRTIHRALAKAGPGHQRSVRIPDLIVAAVAERHQLPVLHYDEDFDRIGVITGQPTRWIAPRGSLS